MKVKTVIMPVTFKVENEFEFKFEGATTEIEVSVEEIAQALASNEKSFLAKLQAYGRALKFVWLQLPTQILKVRMALEAPIRKRLDLSNTKMDEMFDEMLDGLKAEMQRLSRLSADESHGTMEVEI